MVPWAYLVSVSQRITRHLMEWVAPVVGIRFPWHSLAVCCAFFGAFGAYLGFGVCGLSLGRPLVWGPRWGLQQGCLKVPPVTGRTTLLIEPRVVPFGLAPAGFCLGRLSTTAAWCACASCLRSLGALVCIAWVFVMLHVPSASVRWVFGIPLLVSGLNWCVHPNPGIVSC